jgi:hypothetical protein
VPFRCILPLVPLFAAGGTYRRFHTSAAGASVTGNDNALPVTRRSGSEKRQRSAPVSVRFLPDERAAVEANARSVGLTVAGFLRAAALGSPGPRAQRAPSFDARALAVAAGALNRVGSNLNQIARVLNAGGATITAGECRTVLDDVRSAVASILDIVGREVQR